MTSDEQFILALMAIVANVIGLYLNYRKTEQTHTLVNGLTKNAARRARAATLRQERQDVLDNKTAAAMATRPLKNRPVEAGRGYSDV